MFSVAFNLEGPVLRPRVRNTALQKQQQQQLQRLAVLQERSVALATSVAASGSVARAISGPGSSSCNSIGSVQQRVAGTLSVPPAAAVASTSGVAGSCGPGSSNGGEQHLQAPQRSQSLTDPQVRNLIIDM